MENKSQPNPFYSCIMLFAVIYVLGGLSITCVLRLYNTTDFKCQISCSHNDAKHKKKTQTQILPSLSSSSTLTCPRSQKNLEIMGVCTNQRYIENEIVLKSSATENEIAGTTNQHQIGGFDRISESNRESIKLFLIWTNPSHFVYIYKSNSSSPFLFSVFFFFVVFLMPRRRLVLSYPSILSVHAHHGRRTRSLRRMNNLVGQYYFCVHSVVRFFPTGISPRSRNVIII